MASIRTDDVSRAYSNPLIAEFSGDTLTNVHAVNSAMQFLLTRTTKADEQIASTESLYGLALIFDCILDALQFEIEERPS